MRMQVQLTRSDLQITLTCKNMRITSKGQVTIPSELREQLGFLPSTEVRFEVDGGTLRLVKIPAEKGTSRGMKALGLLKGSASVRLSTEEILALTRGE